MNPTPLFSTLSQILICQRRSERGSIRELRSVIKVRSSSASGVIVVMEGGDELVKNNTDRGVIGVLSKNFMEAFLWNATWR